MVAYLAGVIVVFIIVKIFGMPARWPMMVLFSVFVSNIGLSTGSLFLAEELLQQAWGSGRSLALAYWFWTALFLLGVLFLLGAPRPGRSAMVFCLISVAVGHVGGGALLKHVRQLTDTSGAPPSDAG